MIRTTIFAAATGSVRAAIAVLRISGPECSEILLKLCGKLPIPRQAALRTIRAADGTPVALGYHTGHWEVGLLMEAAARIFTREGAIPFAAWATRGRSPRCRRPTENRGAPGRRGAQERRYTCAPQHDPPTPQSVRQR